MLKIKDLTGSHRSADTGTKSKSKNKTVGLYPQA